MPISRLLRALKIYSITSAVGSSLAIPILHLNNLHEYKSYSVIIVLTTLTAYIFSVMLESLSRDDANIS